jgi:hypothetical protein
MIPPVMQPFQSGGQPKNAAKNVEGKSLLRPPSDRYATLFSDANRRPSGGDPLSATRRSDRGARIANEVKRALFFALILVAVAFVIIELVSAF